MQLTSLPVSAGPARTPNTLEWEMKNAEGEAFRIQAAWPLGWESPDAAGREACMIYVLDGNAVFFTAVEAVRRSSAVLPTSDDAIVVGIGYPVDNVPYPSRRHYDLTPPSPSYTAPRGSDGQRRSEAHGGATILLDFIVHTVREFLLSKVFSGVNIRKEALSGHSYGGLCALHALFGRLTPFDTFICLSPSIWWNESYILEEEETFREADEAENTSLPTLLVAYGSFEQEPRRRSIWSEEKYKLILELMHERQMGGNATDLVQRIRQCKKCKKVKIKEYTEEDHGSVLPCGMSWGIGVFLDDERFP